jgi:hypothetical protein
LGRRLLELLDLLGDELNQLLELLELHRDQLNQLLQLLERTTSCVYGVREMQQSVDKLGSSSQEPLLFSPRVVNRQTPNTSQAAYQKSTDGRGRGFARFSIEEE